MYAPKLNVMVTTAAQYKVVRKLKEEGFADINEIIAEADIFIDDISEDDIQCYGDVRVAYPYVMRNVNIKAYEKVLVRSADELEFCKENGCSDIASDYGLYCMNEESEAFLVREGISRMTAPVELNEHELKALGVKDKELIVYGYIPSMVSAQCVNKNINGCDGQNRVLSIKDRKGKELKVQCRCEYCYNLIYNSVPMSLLGVWDKVERLAPEYVRINFTTEGESEIRRVLKAFGNKCDPEGEFTRGHFGRGVE